MSSSSISSSSSSSSLNSMAVESPKQGLAPRLDWVVQNLQSISLSSRDPEEKAPIAPTRSSASLESVEELALERNFKTALKEAHKIGNFIEKGMAFRFIAEELARAGLLQRAREVVLEGFFENYLDPYDTDDILGMIAKIYFQENEMGEMLSTALEMQTDFLKKDMCLFLLEKGVIGPAETIFHTISETAQREPIIFNMVKRWARLKNWEKSQQWISFLPETSLLRERAIFEVRRQQINKENRGKANVDDKKRIREENAPSFSAKSIKSYEHQRAGRVENEPKSHLKFSSPNQKANLPEPAHFVLGTMKSGLKKETPSPGKLSSFIHSEKSEKEELSPLWMPSQRKAKSSDSDVEEMMDEDFFL